MDWADAISDGYLSFLPGVPTSRNEHRQEKVVH
jgi:hypothetical protein